MTREQLIVVVIMVVVVIVISLTRVSKNRHRIKRMILDRLNINSEAGQCNTHEPEQACDESEADIRTAEESKAELERLQKLIEDRKQIAWESDISHHLWGLYKGFLPQMGPQSVDGHNQDGEWYDVRVLKVSTQNGLNRFEFELKGARYTFVDDEEKQGWRENVKFFSLFLYDDSDRCLIEIPMKMKVDSSGRTYSITPNGPKAFLLGGWINDFINVKLKHQSIRNQEIRAQKHRERLSEIEDLKNRFGIRD